MNTYRIEMMTNADYDNYMTGGFNYWVHKVDIEANTKEEAVEIAKNNYCDMVINENYVKTVEEIEAEAKAEEEKRTAREKAEAEKKAKAKARKEERERTNAEAMGLTIEEYRIKVKNDKKIKAVEKRIAELKAEIAKEERKLKNLRKEA